MQSQTQSEDFGFNTSRPWPYFDIDIHRKFTSSLSYNTLSPSDPNYDDDIQEIIPIDVETDSCNILDSVLVIPDVELDISAKIPGIPDHPIPVFSDPISVILNEKPEPDLPVADEIFNVNPDVPDPTPLILNREPDILDPLSVILNGNQDISALIPDIPDPIWPISCDNSINTDPLNSIISLCINLSPPESVLDVNQETVPTDMELETDLGTYNVPNPSTGDVNNAPDDSSCSPRPTFSAEEFLFATVYPESAISTTAEEDAEMDESLARLDDQTVDAVIGALDCFFNGLIMIPDQVIQPNSIVQDLSNLYFGKETLNSHVSSESDDEETESD